MFFAPKFDPYRKWLGIPADRRPPTYYDILGITRGESDHDVIRSAAEQRRAFIQGKKSEGHDDLVAKISKEIDDAVACLLVPSFKSEYDRRIGVLGKKSRKLQNHPLPPWFDGLRERIYGEGSGIISSVAGIMAVIGLAIGTMIWFSFQMPWGKIVRVQPPAEEHSTEPSAPAELSPNTATSEPDTEVPPEIAALTPPPLPTSTPVENRMTQTSNTPPEVWLNSMPMVAKYEAFGWWSTNGEVILGGKEGRPLSVRPLRLENQPSSHGVYIHATGHERNGSVTFQIAKQFSQLKTTAFIPDALPNQGHPRSPIVFEVVGDGKRLWISDPLYQKNDKAECIVPIVGVDRLTLQVQAAPPTNWCLAAWHNPQLLRDATTLASATLSTKETNPAADPSGLTKHSFPKVVQILETKEQDWNLSKTDYVKIDGLQFELGMGSGDYGIAAAGWHVKGVTKVEMQGRFLGVPRIHDAHSFTGLIVDYGVNNRFVKKVTFNAMRVKEKRTLSIPAWGKHGPPDVSVQLNEENRYEFELRKWAPPEWNGEAWITVLLQNSGKNTKIFGNLRFAPDL